MALRLILFLAIFGILNLKLGQGQVPAQKDRQVIAIPAESIHITTQGTSMGLKMEGFAIKNHRELQINKFSFQWTKKEGDEYYWYAINDLTHFDKMNGKYNTKSIPSLRLTTRYSCDEVTTHTEYPLDIELPERTGWDAYKYVMLGNNLTNGNNEGLAAGYVDLGENKFGPCFLQRFIIPSCPKNCIGTCLETNDTICETALDEERKREITTTKKTIQREGSKKAGSKGLSAQSPLVALLFFLTAGIWICYAGIQSWISKVSFSTC